ncbi:MAG: NADH-quinone oxidoreductase subunit C, partial [Thermoprotei archaeon]
EEEIANALKERFGDKIVSIEIPRKRRVFVEVSKDCYKDVVKFLLNDLDMKHVEGLTGVDAKDHFEVIVHIGYGISVSVKTKIPRDNPVIDSLCDIAKGVELYEREAYDLLGIVFEGHPNLKRFILPEDWPEGVYPLRKDYEAEHPEPLR